MFVKKLKQTNSHIIFYWYKLPRNVTNEYNSM